MVSGITREVAGVPHSITVEHLPGRRRPLLVASIGNVGYKVGEITDETVLKGVAERIFHDVEREDK